MTCTVDNPLAKARGLSLRTDAQTMLYLSLIVYFVSVVSRGASFCKNGGTYGNVPIPYLITDSVNTQIQIRRDEFSTAQVNSVCCCLSAYISTHLLRKE